MAGIWTTQAVEARLNEASFTLAQLPPDRAAAGLGRLKVAWPDVPRDWWSVYGGDTAQEDLRTTSRSRGASAEQIGRLDEVLDWAMQWLRPEALEAMGLPPDTAGLLWMRAARRRWSEIAAWRRKRWRGRVPQGNSRESLRLLHHSGLRHLSGWLNERHVEIRPAAEEFQRDAMQGPPGAAPVLRPTRRILDLCSALATGWLPWGIRVPDPALMWNGEPGRAGRYLLYSCLAKAQPRPFAIGITRPEARPLVEAGVLEEPLDRALDELRLTTHGRDWLGYNWQKAR